MCALKDRKPGFDSEFTGTELKIKLRGEIDHHNAVTIRGAVDEILRSSRPTQLVIDMSAVDFMDSSGLGLIMGRYAIMKELGGRLLVSDPSPATEKIMKLAGMERIVKIVHINNEDGRISPSDTNAVNKAAETVGTKRRKREVSRK